MGLDFMACNSIVKIISGNLPNIIWKNFLLSFSRAYPSMFSLSAKKKHYGITYDNKYVVNIPSQLLDEYRH